MSTERYVVLGLAPVRSPWFHEVARWATSGALPVEFVKCVSAAELRSRVGSGRPFSAALLDVRLPAVDRDLLAILAASGIAALAVGDDGRDWSSLGAAARLPADHGAQDLLSALADHARPVARLDDPTGSVVPGTDDPSGPAAWRGRLVTVMGRSGAGTSTVAAALAQHLADDPRHAADVLLVDLARHAHQGLLHDAGDLVPGLQELVEAHRSGHLAPGEVHALTFEVVDRGYRLVLGLRRPRDWVAIRARAFAAALDSLTRAARVVVADADEDLEGEDDTGSFDIEDRNLLARTAASEADLVVIVASPTTTGLHDLVGSVAALRRHGVAPERVLAVLNRAPRRTRARAELTRAVAELVGLGGEVPPHLGPAFVPSVRGLDHVHRDVARLPSPIAGGAGRAVAAALDRLDLRRLDRNEPTADPHGATPIAPGSLAAWTEPEEGVGR